MKHVRQSLFPLSDGFGIKRDDVSPRPAEKFLRCFKREIFDSIPLILAFVGEEDERDEEEREEDQEEGERRTTTNNKTTPNCASRHSNLVIKSWVDLHCFVTNKNPLLLFHSVQIAIWKLSTLMKDGLLSPPCSSSLRIFA